jgi:ribonuclease BN (tRNA processing enzyme)
MTRSGAGQRGSGQCARWTILALLLGLCGSGSGAATAADTASGSTATVAQPPGASTHSTRLILLGTAGGPNIRRYRSEPASLLVVDGTPYLIDAGAGVTRQIVWAGFQLPQIHTIFITHHHADHNAGLEPLISLIWFNRAIRPQPSAPVSIYGPPATRFLVDAALRFLSVSERIFRAGLDLQPAAPIFQAHDITHDGLVYQDAHVRVTAATNSHYHEVSRGPDGVEDRSYSYRFDTPTRSVVFTGDTGMSDSLIKLAQGADVLVSEVYAPAPAAPATGAGASANAASGAGAADMASPASGHTKLAQQFAFHMQQEHLRPEQIGQLATAAHVKAVVLTHLVPGDDAETDMSRYSAGVRRYYDGPVIVGKDLFEF